MGTIDNVVSKQWMFPTTYPQALSNGVWLRRDNVRVTVDVAIDPLASLPISFFPIVSVGEVLGVICTWS